MPAMGQIIQWCNNNDGFTSAILSVIGLGLSVIAIWVSISTARLPYRKKITVQMNTVYGVFDVPGLCDQLEGSNFVSFYRLFRRKTDIYPWA